MRSRAFAQGIALWLRAALAASFLSAVADRFGIWGPNGAPGVAWGDFTHFTDYTHQLTAFLPGSATPILAWITTIAEVGLAIGLILGWRTRVVALSSGLLLLIFALAMMMVRGIKAPLDYSVFSASAGACLLGCSEHVGFGIDQFRGIERARWIWKATA